MNVSLTPELEDYINQQVKSGMYHSASEVVRDSLRILIDRQKKDTAMIESFRSDVMIGYEQAKRGESSPLDRAAMRERGMRRLAEMND